MWISGRKLQYQQQAQGEDESSFATHDVAIAPKSKDKKPSLYKVLLLNDDYTPQDFVIWLLESVFNKTSDEALTIMLHVHNNGVGICGVYSFDIAETKVTQVLELALQNEHPLQCAMEKA